MNNWSLKWLHSVLPLLLHQRSLPATQVFHSSCLFHVALITELMCLLVITCYNISLDIITVCLYTYIHSYHALIVAMAITIPASWSKGEQLGAGGLYSKVITLYCHVSAVIWLAIICCLYVVNCHHKVH